MEKYTLGKPLIIKEKLQIPNSRFVKKYIYTTNHNNDKINYLDSDDFERDYSQLWNSIELLNQ